MEYADKNGYSRPENLERGHASTPEWSMLASRAVADLSRIIAAEIKLLELGLASAIRAELVRFVIALALGSMAVFAAFCLLAALILFVHQWFAWWASFAICGGATLLAAIVLWEILSASLPQRPA